MKNPLTHAIQSSTTHQTRAEIQSLPNHCTELPVLTNRSAKPLLEQRQQKKRVRFALRLESIQETTFSQSKQDQFAASTTRRSKRIVDPWRDNGPLYGAYVEYLEKRGALTCDKSEEHQSPRPVPLSPSLTPSLPPLESPAEPPQYTHTFYPQTKSHDIKSNSVNVVAPSVQLPQITQQVIQTKNPNDQNNTFTNRRSSLPMIDSNLQVKCVSAISRTTQSKKVATSNSSKRSTTAAHSNILQGDHTLKPMKDLNFKEKVSRTDHAVGSKFMNEYYKAKRLTEIIAGALPGTNNQIHYISNRTILPNVSKQPSTPCHNEINSDSYFFQTHNTDHLQSVIN